MQAQEVEYDPWGEQIKIKKEAFHRFLPFGPPAISPLLAEPPSQLIILNSSLPLADLTTSALFSQMPKLSFSFPGSDF